MKTEAGHFVFCEHEAGPLGENAGARDEQGSATGWRPKGVAVLVFLLAVLAPAPLAAQKRSGDLLKFADQILSEISNMRGLEVRSPVNKGIKSRPQIQAALQEKISQEYTREELEIEEKTLKKLGLLPPEYDYVGGFVQLITEQLAGYYDPETKTLYIADWVPARHQRMTMAHELAHALQDQHFNLSEILKESKGNDDQALARQAVVEGEALAIMFDHILRPSKRTFLNLPNIMEFYQRLEGKDTPGQKALSSAPEFLRQTLLFPYLYGARFLQVYRKWHPWDDLARVYADLPASTEQIMHPEKYTGRRDHPTLVEAETPPLLVGWNSIYQNVLGEFVTYLVLREYLSERTAKLASKGWDGDSIQLFEHGDGRTGLYLLSVWDSERDSEQFFTAYSSLIPEKYPDVEQVEEPGVGGPQAEWKSRHHRIRVELDGTWVRIVEWELPRGNEAT